MNESASWQRIFIRVSDVAGAIRGTYERLCMESVLFSGQLGRFGRFDSPALVAELSEGNSLLGRQVNDDEAIDTGGMAILEQLLLAVA